MKLLHLYYFKILAENENLTVAAEKIHISPPALSTSISKLENELGTSLFERTGKGMKLNDKGRMVYVHVCSIFSELDVISNELKKESHQKQIIHVGVTAPMLWNDVIDSYMISKRDVTVQHSILTTEQLKDSDLLNNFDFIITDINALNSSTWDHSFIIEDPPVFLVHANHRFAGRQSVPLLEAKEEAFIALSNNYSSSEFFKSSCMQAGFIPNIVAETSYSLRARLVASKYGIAFSTVLGAHPFLSDTVKMIPIEKPTIIRMQSIFWKKGKPLPYYCQDFRDYVLTFCKDNLPIQNR